MPVLPSELQRAGRTVKGSMMCGDNAQPGPFIFALIELWKEGRLPFDKLIRTCLFAAINHAIADARSGDAIKPMLLMPEADGSARLA